MDNNFGNQLSQLANEVNWLERIKAIYKPKTEKKVQLTLVKNTLVELQKVLDKGER